MTKKQTGKFQQAFTHVIRDFEKDKNVIDDCRNVLKNEFFTKVLSTYSNLQKFQEVITNDDDFVLKYQGFLASSLIAAKLKGKAELDKLIDFFWIKEDMSSKDDRHILKQLISNFAVYAEKFPDPAVAVS